MIKVEKILSICIPTYNRAKYLDMSLTAITQQILELETNEVEILVSDNCSSDNTQKVVEKYHELQVNYIRNAENIGADNNFLQCMNKAIGKYILLLGDDDILQPGSIKYIIKVLKEKDWGCMYLSIGHKEMGKEEYDKCDDFIRRVSYMFTFMSVNIFRKDSISLIKNPDKYKGCNLLQMPFYINSALSRNDNVVVKGDFLRCGLAINSNGGYNPFRVFVENYLNIWKEFLEKKLISKSNYIYIKKDVYNSYTKHHVLWLLFNRENIYNPNKGVNTGYSIENAWGILFKHYGKESYFYISFLWCLYASFRHRVGKLVKPIIERFSK